MRLPQSAVVATLLAFTAFAGACASDSRSSAEPTSVEAGPVETGPVEAGPVETGTAEPGPSASGRADGTSIESLVDTITTSGRVDLDASGNRVISGPARVIGSEPERLELPGDSTPAWIAPAGSGRWLVVHVDGAVSLVDPADGSVDEVEPAGTFDTAAGPPLVVGDDVTDDGAARLVFEDPLPDTRIVTDGDSLVALAGPSDRYAHAVLGDEIEATAIEVVDADTAARSTTPIRLDEPDVFEAISPMLADIDGDGRSEILATVSNSSNGARLVAYSFDGDLVAESDPIGQGNRWRNLLAVAPIGPDGEVEVVDVRTPHIGGTLQFFRVDGDRLERVAAAGTYSTHRIGSRNLDLGIVVDADGDARLDVLLPTQDRSELVAVTRVADADDGTRELGRIELGAQLATNVAASTNPDGSVAVAVGTSDGSLLIWT